MIIVRKEMHHVVGYTWSFFDAGTGEHSTFLVVSIKDGISNVIEVGEAEKMIETILSERDGEG